MASFALIGGFVRPVSTPVGSARHCPTLSTLAPPQPRLRAGAAFVCHATSTDAAMEAAQRRWEAQVRDGKVRNVTAAEVQGLMESGWTLLDVRPKEEIAKARIEGAVEVPLFVMDEELSVGTFIKQLTNFGMGGWWLGGGHTIPNPSFMADVQARVPQDAKLVVVCQKGLRSLAACEQLSRAGYGALSWINGGLDTARPGDVPTKDGVDIRMGGVGGLSGYLGWTEPQREAGQSFAGGFENVLRGVAVVLVLDVAWFVWTITNP